MANEEHLVKLTEGVSVWNEWRKNSPDIRPDLRGAELKGVNLQGAQLQEANLRWGQHQGADLRDVEGLTKGQIESARIDDKTKLPDGLGPSK